MNNILKKIDKRIVIVSKNKKVLRIADDSKICTHYLWYNMVFYGNQWKNA